MNPLHLFVNVLAIIGGLCTVSFVGFVLLMLRVTAVAKHRQQQSRSAEHATLSLPYGVLRPLIASKIGSRAMVQSTPTLLDALSQVPEMNAIPPHVERN